MAIAALSVWIGRTLSVLPPPVHRLLDRWAHQRALQKKARRLAAMRLKQAR